MVIADPRAVAAVERLFEPDEQLVQWSTWYESIEWRGRLEWRRYVLSASAATKPRSLILTTTRLFSVTFTQPLFGPPTTVETYWARPLATFFAWRITKRTDSRGALNCYSFTVTARDGLPKGPLEAYPRDVELFIEAFTAASARFKALTGTGEVAAQLSAMHALWSEGALTDAEFQRAKELFLGKPPDAEQRAAAALRHLKALLDSGILTDSEFRTKKWQVLSA